MESSGPSARRRMLIEALRVVAAAAAVQVAWLDKYGVPPDEIALDFDDAVGLAGQLVEDGQLGREVLSSLQMIDEVFNEMTQDSNVDRWTREALSTDAGWAHARQLAREVLTAQGEQPTPLPDICVIR